MGSALLCNKRQHNKIILHDHCNGNQDFQNEFESYGCKCHHNFSKIQASGFSAKGKAFVKDAFI